MPSRRVAPSRTLHPHEEQRRHPEAARSTKCFSRIWSYVILTRPLNVLIGGLSIFVGALVTGTIQPLRHVLIACASGSLVAAGANAINDYFDLEIDRRNKPYRPLPAGKITRRQAQVFALALLLLGSVLGAAIGPVPLLVATSTATLLYVYSWRLKRTVLWGNLVVSAATALAFIYGGLAVGRPAAALIPAGFALLFHLGREIIKDVEDMHGDRLEGAMTLPIRHGRRTALMVATAVYALVVVVTPLPYLGGVYDLPYLLVVVAGVDTVVAYVVVQMWRQPDPSTLHRLSELLKADMFVGLVAIYVGR
ncbi:MAG: geranylgeranylglycerol-phosphate geranylgeranyltransferase [Calditrichaeota bacterium]|nr:geranylgeranylglycerol-phosphate geranylgeranyltransferase [Calditrichota bacterium]